VAIVLRDYVYDIMNPTVNLGDKRSVTFSSGNHGTQGNKPYLTLTR
jgi:hypothetical protein